MKQDGLDNKHLKPDHGPKNVNPLDPQWGNFDSSILSTYCVLEETRCVQVACGTTSCCVHLILFLRGDLRCICSTKTFMKLQGSKIIFMILAPIRLVIPSYQASWILVLSGGLQSLWKRSSFFNLEIQIVFKFSWQIGAGKYSHFPIKWNTVYFFNIDTILVNWNESDCFLNCDWQMVLILGIWPYNTYFRLHHGNLGQIVEVLGKWPYTEAEKMTCMWFGEICYCCS